MPWSFDGGSPIYYQIIEQIKLRIAIGEYKPGDKIKPVRELASGVGVNPNTMQKALAELEREGLLYTQRTSGRYITEDKALIDGLKTALAEKHIGRYLKSMALLGYSKEEAVEHLSKHIYNNERNDLE